jgi:Flp pilus assembly pilin Flp
MADNIMTRRKTALRRLKNKKGQTLVEYALILAFISMVGISVLIALGIQVKTVFTTVARQLAIGGNGGTASTPPSPPPSQGHGG